MGSPNQVGWAIEKLTKLLVGGLPVSGMLRLTATDLVFTPSTMWLQKIYYKDLPEVTIPRQEIGRIYKMPSLLGVSARLNKPMVVVETVNGNFNINSGAFLFSNRRLAKALNAALGR